MSQILVKNIGLLVTNNPSLGSTQLGILKNAALLAENGQITWVGDSQSAPTAQNVIDADGKCVIPWLCRFSYPFNFCRRSQQ